MKKYINKTTIHKKPSKDERQSVQDLVMQMFNQYPIGRYGTRDWFFDTISSVNECIGIYDVKLIKPGRHFNSDNDIEIELKYTKGIVTRIQINRELFEGDSGYMTNRLLYNDFNWKVDLMEYLIEPKEIIEEKIQKKEIESKHFVKRMLSKLL